MSIKEKYEADLKKINALLNYAAHQADTKFPFAFLIYFEIEDSELAVSKAYSDSMLELHKKLHAYKTALETKIASL